MYVPKFNRVDNPNEVLDMVRAVGFGHLVSAAGGAIESTPLPFVVDDGMTSVTAHLARANPHWQQLDGADVLLIVPGADGYVSPNWYPSKHVDGKAVPTWNYELVHIRGRVTVHSEAEWLHAMVSSLTDHHESVLSTETGAEQWQVSDAPDDYINKQLRAIVGIEIAVTEVTGKKKLSQNKDTADLHGVIDGLQQRPASAASELAEMMRNVGGPQ